MCPGSDQCRGETARGSPWRRACCTVHGAHTAGTLRRPKAAIDKPGPAAGREESRDLLAMHRVGLGICRPRAAFQLSLTLGGLGVPQNP